MTTETGTLQFDSFDLLLNDVLHSVANPEMPERLRAGVQTRVWMQRAEAPSTPVFAAAAVTGPQLVSPARAAVPAFGASPCHTTLEMSPIRPH